MYRFVIGIAVTVQLFAGVIIADTAAAAPAPQLTVETFATTDADYNGIRVGFMGQDFGTVTAVTVDITRADGSHVVKQGRQPLFDTLSSATSPTHTVAPIVIKEGSFIEANDVNWQPAGPTAWTVDTTPTNVTVTVTDETGQTEASSIALDQAAASYVSLLPPVVVVPPAVDTTPPVLTIDGPSTMTLEDTVTFTIVADEPLAALQVFIGSDQLTTGIEKVSDTTWTVTYTPADVGTYTLVARGDDVAGNRSGDVMATIAVTPTLPTVEQTTTASRQLEAAVTSLTQPLNAVIDVEPVPLMGKNVADTTDIATLGNLAEKTIDTTRQTDDTTGGVVSTKNGWKIAGLLWYWWALLIGVVATIGWRTVAAVRRRRSDVVQRSMS